MANIYKGTLGLIGNTPLIEAINLEKAYNLEAKLLLTVLLLLHLQSLLLRYGPLRFLPD